MLLPCWQRFAKLFKMRQRSNKCSLTKFTKISPVQVYRTITFVYIFSTAVYLSLEVHQDYVYLGPHVAVRMTPPCSRRCSECKVNAHEGCVCHMVAGTGVPLLCVAYAIPVGACCLEVIRSRSAVLLGTALMHDASNAPPHHR